MITPKLSNGLLDDADNETKFNSCKKRGARNSYWLKYNSHFIYPGEKIMNKTLQHTTKMGKISSKIPFQLHHKSRNIFLQRTRLI